MSTTTFSGPVVSHNGFQLPALTTTEINAIGQHQILSNIVNNTFAMPVNKAIQSQVVINQVEYFLIYNI